MFACARWNEGRDDADPITRSHFRHLYSATANEPAPLVAGGTPCIKVRPSPRECPAQLPVSCAPAAWCTATMLVTATRPTAGSNVRQSCVFDAPSSFARHAQQATPHVCVLIICHVTVVRIDIRPSSLQVRCRWLLTWVECEVRL